ncbi:unnamed protein product [Moneuplotes crassus]|uniref:Uncharacterized protein n=1 Tax=Euplotes crassus TaxID=5936 RepID=A0AAD1UP23_EUPCR|nr:unnamed protein product [Moneuplotes crassus]
MIPTLSLPHLVKSSKAKVLCKVKDPSRFLYTLDIDDTTNKSMTGLVTSKAHKLSMKYRFQNRHKAYQSSMGGSKLSTTGVEEVNDLSQIKLPPLSKASATPVATRGTKILNFQREELAKESAIDRSFSELKEIKLRTPIKISNKLKKVTKELNKEPLKPEIQKPEIQKPIKFRNANTQTSSEQVVVKKVTIRPKKVPKINYLTAYLDSLVEDYKLSRRKISRKTKKRRIKPALPKFS